MAESTAELPTAALGCSLVPLAEIPVSEVLELMDLSLGQGALPRSEAFWRWKHLENPFGPSPGVAAVAEDGTLAAIRAFLRWRFVSGGRCCEAVRAVDTATHPCWRRRGLFRALTLDLVEEMRRQGETLVFNTPNRRSRRGYLKMGWVPLGRAPLLIRPLHPAALLRPPMTAPAANAPSLDAFAPASELLAQPGIGRFLEATCRGDDLRWSTPRREAYLRWRYGRVPGLDYRVLWTLGETAGAAILFRGRLRRRLREVAVSEILTTPDGEGPRLAARLLQRLARELDADYLVAAAAARTRERQALRGAGFLPFSAVGPRITIRTLEGPAGAPDLRRSRSWRWSLGDLEIF